MRKEGLQHSYQHVCLSPAQWSTCWLSCTQMWKHCLTSNNEHFRHVLYIYVVQLFSYSAEYMTAFLFDAASKRAHFEGTVKWQLAVILWSWNLMESLKYTHLYHKAYPTVNWNGNRMSNNANNTHPQLPFQTLHCNTVFKTQQMTSGRSLFYSRALSGVKATWYLLPPRPYSVLYTSSHVAMFLMSLVAISGFPVSLLVL